MLTLQLTRGAGFPDGGQAVRFEGGVEGCYTPRGRCAGKGGCAEKAILMTGRSTNETECVICIGSVIGGEFPGNAAILEVLREVRAICDAVDLRAHQGDLRVDLDFGVAGSLWQPDYEGVRTGRLSRPKRLLQVQVAVPLGLTAQEARRFFIDAITEAARLAKAFVDDHRLPYSTSNLETTAEALKLAIEQPTQLE